MTNFLSDARGPQVWAESKFVKTNFCDQVDFSPFRGPDAPFALGDLITKAEKCLIAAANSDSLRRRKLALLVLFFNQMATAALAEDQWGKCMYARVNLECEENIVR